MNMPPLPPASGQEPPPDPRRAPLDADEAALARALLDVPASAPSAELDLRILAMARGAIEDKSQKTAHSAKPRRHARRKPSLLWWMGTAAGAVMAAGIGWQLGGFGEPGTPAAGPPTAQETRAAAAKADDVDILIIPRSPSEAASPPAAVAPSPPPATAAQRSALAERESRRREISAADGSSAAPPPPVEATPAPPASPAPSPMSPQSLGALPAADAPGANTQQANGDGQPQLDQIVVTGSRVQRGGGDFPPVAQDFRLSPEEWLQRVRERRDSGDLDSARRSVREFVRAHPLRVLPQDLRQLLNETQ